MVVVQRNKLLDYARDIQPGLTFEDILQPQDYPDLDNDPEFRFEEGYLMGLESMLAACRAYLNLKSDIWK